MDLYSRWFPIAYLQLLNIAMENNDLTPTGVDRHTAAASPAQAASLLKWHLGAFGWSIGLLLVAVGLGNARDYSASSEPLEYVFSVFWHVLDNLIPNVIFSLLAWWGLRSMRRHMAWSLPDVNRLSAVVLLSMVSLPLLLLMVAQSVEVGTAWFAGQKTQTSQNGQLFMFCAAIASGCPWAYSQYRVWRTFSDR